MQVGSSSSSSSDLTNPNQNSPVLSQRQNVVREILSTEESYVKSLSICDNYRTSMLKNASKINPREVETIFYSFNDVFACNKKFVMNLSNSFKQNNLDNEVGKIFLGYAQSFLAYTNFYINHDKATEHIKRLKSDSKVSSLMEEIQNSVSVQQQLDLIDYFIMPIQRLPRYKLLLEQLIKFTPPTHCDFDNITKAYTSIGNVVTEINKKMLNERSIVELESLRCLFSKKEKFELVKENRRFIMQKKITQVTHNGAEKRVLFLLSDCLLLTKREDRLLKIRYVVELDKFKFFEIDKPKAVQIFSNVKSCLIEFESEDALTQFKNSITNVLLKIDKKEFLCSPLVVQSSDITNCTRCGVDCTRRRKKMYCKKCKLFVCPRCWNHDEKCCVACQNTICRDTKKRRSMSSAKGMKLELDSCTHTKGTLSGESTPRLSETKTFGTRVQKCRTENEIEKIGRTREINPNVKLYGSEQLEMHKDSPPFEDVQLKKHSIGKTVLCRFSEPTKPKESPQTNTISDAACFPCDQETLLSDNDTQTPREKQKKTGCMSDREDSGHKIHNLFRRHNSLKHKDKIEVPDTTKDVNFITGKQKVDRLFNPNEVLTSPIHKSSKTLNKTLRSHTRTPGGVEQIKLYIDGVLVNNDTLEMPKAGTHQEPEKFEEFKEDEKKSTNNSESNSDNSDTGTKTNTMLNIEKPSDETFKDSLGSQVCMDSKPIELEYTQPKEHTFEIQPERTPEGVESVFKDLKETQETEHRTDVKQMKTIFERKSEEVCEPKPSPRRLSQRIFVNKPKQNIEIDLDSLSKSKVCIDEIVPHEGRVEFLRQFNERIIKKNSMENQEKPKPKITTVDKK
ncbi:Rho/RAC guanine nucleotide exchange factor, putative [Entamoeba invadens IP1]|uniref:Rho/RAC guanine nucleotide exchange factor, putative n=1 Tax=Entamoeba invadens IP1 TaxID=370355 RepID=A0A0A1TYP4_ENTIV|nr:Rho/RAC guanine nucleotide exchange factor, putative [Entamoeba invadens IP1]ELP86646.1 Rho/RAC guanine nucleotide exchange factor, putative [Entamoeba invadens IP1]|eukprot:XP_004185992.1 Rho/RAC guanine nucleotide exchange factor, putative [Entamoeba invadens IP1]